MDYLTDMTTKIPPFISFLYIPQIKCPYCNHFIDCEDLDNKREILEFENGILCPKCGELIPYEEFKLIKKWKCRKCENEFPENALIDLHSKKRFECPECGTIGQIGGTFKKFKYRTSKGGWLVFVCPYTECRKSYPVTELKPNGDGVVAKCPVCQRFAEMPAKELNNPLIFTSFYNPNLLLCQAVIQLITTVPSIKYSKISPESYFVREKFASGNSIWIFPPPFQ